MSTIAKTKLILASASPRRLALLRQLAIEPDYVYSTDIDEAPKYREHPRFLAKRLAQEKAFCAYEHIANLSEYKDSLILSADTVVSVGRMILPKAQTIEEAEECLKLLSGRGHKVFTAVAMINKSGRISTKLSENRVRFMRLTAENMEAYLKSYEWMGKAGGYAIQGFASSFILRLVGSYSSVMGLPLSIVFAMLRANNYPVCSNWLKDEFSLKS